MRPARTHWPAFFRKGAFALFPVGSFGHSLSTPKRIVPWPFALITVMAILVLAAGVAWYQYHRQGNTLTHSVTANITNGGTASPTVSTTLTKPMSLPSPTNGLPLASGTTPPQRDDSTAAPGHTSVQVTVNGQSIPVPANGSSHQVIQDNAGQTTVNITTHTNTTSASDGNGGSTSTDLQLNTENTSDNWSVP